MRKKISSLILQSLKFIFALALSFTLLAAIIIFIFRFFDPPVTAFMLNNSKLSFSNPFYEDNQDQEWVGLNRISKNLTLAVIASEDQKFINHFGFDIEQIEKAYVEMEKGSRVRGASTISQQVVKNLFLSNSKNFIRKGIEAELTLLLELLWSKQRIIEVYLNIAEFGENIYGAEAASNYYFKKSAYKLNKNEAAKLAAVLPNPVRFSILKPTGRLLHRKERIMKFMEQIGGISSIESLY